MISSTVSTASATTQDRRCGCCGRSPPWPEDEQPEDSLVDRSAVPHPAAEHSLHRSLAVTDHFLHGQRPAALGAGRCSDGRPVFPAARISVGGGIPSCGLGCWYLC